MDLLLRKMSRRHTTRLITYPRMQLVRWNGCVKISQIDLGHRVNFSSTTLEIPGSRALKQRML